MSDHNPYVTSIIFKYGDTYNVKKDVETLNEILGRQGTGLLIDVVAEHAGQSSLKFNYTATESMRLINTLIDQLRNALLERL